MPTTNGDNSYERIGGTQDTENNATDFAGPKPGNPQNFGADRQRRRAERDEHDAGERSRRTSRGMRASRSSSASR